MDIIIPSKNIAIEFDGLYWHNETKVNKNYHLNKTIECLTNGIRLIHIFEDEWVNKKEIVKSRLNTILGNVTNKIYARKCEIKEISNETCKTFLDNNHIQGGINAPIRYGLFYNDDLVSVMNFCKPRKNLGQSGSKNEYELLNNQYEVIVVDNLSTDKTAMQRLKEAAEKAKIELSGVQQTQINLPFITADATGPKHLDITLTRPKFEELIRDLVEATAEPVERALKDAGLTADKINKVFTTVPTII